MGCGESRFDKRKKFANDLNTVSINFIEENSYLYDECPVDKFCLGSNGEILDLYSISGTLALDKE